MKNVLRTFMGYLLGIIIGLFICFFLVALPGIGSVGADAIIAVTTGVEVQSSYVEPDFDLNEVIVFNGLYLLTVIIFLSVGLFITPKYQRKLLLYLALTLYFILSIMLPGGFIFHMLLLLILLGYGFLMHKLMIKPHFVS